MDLRMVRHFTTFAIAQHDSSTMKTIFNAIVSAFLPKLSVPMQELKQHVVDASVELLFTTAESFLPTPAKSHYTFHIRDLVRLFSTLLSQQVAYISSKAQVVKLWYHECTRVFQDRLADFDDRSKFSNIINSITNKYFQVSQEEVADYRDNIFVDFLAGLSFSSARNYELIPG
eukprot:Phypoly_transcript_21224.p1 GENE.Phypoly_transcript_21224~~Phypoly_transcript_21224.p1  ORF type:complete len:188 (+),score=27.67 Phypoly_transcript_21224:46-564(+)